MTSLGGELLTGNVTQERLAPVRQETDPGVQEEDEL